MDERVFLDRPPARADAAEGGDPPTADIFGDGGHPTTELAAELLTARLGERPGARVLDAGTGTGSLAARALAQGAGAVVAVDRDPRAAELARRRAPGARVHARATDDGLADLGPFDLVVANLPEPDLSRSAGILADLLRPGGALIATGILLCFDRRVARALERAGLRVAGRSARSGWLAIVAEPAAAPPGERANAGGAINT